jgi:hypothetical protein
MECRVWNKLNIYLIEWSISNDLGVATIEPLMWWEELECNFWQEDDSDLKGWCEVDGRN